MMCLMSRMGFGANEGLVKARWGTSCCGFRGREIGLRTMQNGQTKGDCDTAAIILRMVVLDGETLEVIKSFEDRHRHIDLPSDETDETRSSNTT